MQPEAKISRSITKMLRDRGAFAFKVWGSEMMMAGLPDVVACYRGLFVAFETKAPEGHVSRRQAYVHALIARAGGVVAVPRSVPDARAVLDGIDSRLAPASDVTNDV